jgi:hypothetical protein
VINPEKIKIRSKKDVEQYVLTAGDGARFYCHVNWKDSKGGHEFLLINDKNNVLVVDGQSGYIEEINRDKNYFEDINFKNSYIVRLDDKKLNDEVLKYNDDKYIVEWNDKLDIPLLESAKNNISSENSFKEKVKKVLDIMKDIEYGTVL